MPPCKVGDTVYAYSEDFFTILPYFVENVNVGYMDESRNYIVYEANCHADETDELLDEIDFDFDDFGKTVFLTREEAEKALENTFKPDTFISILVFKTKSYKYETPVLLLEI